MPLFPSTSDIALRLILTLVASALIGMNREEHGRSAGLRTTMLVSLAAALSMVQVNLLLDLSGKSPSSFIVMDLMRLPLGILSGMGFIGAGAILRRGPYITGVTTAATLWFSTVMGLCFGGGQVGLGLTATVLAILILWALKPIEKYWSRHVRGMLTLSGPDVTQEVVARGITAEGGEIVTWSEAGSDGESSWYACIVKWRSTAARDEIPPFVKRLAQTPGIARVQWKMTGHGY